MNRRLLYLCLGLAVLPGALVVNLSNGAGDVTVSDVLGALTRFDATRYEHAIVLYQRVPQALIATYVGALMAVGGTILQGLIRNPLASPATLGLNSGAALFVVAGAFLFDLSPVPQGAAALAGAMFGFVACIAVARLVGRKNDPRRLSFILSGVLVSMLLTGMTNALLLSDPSRRIEFLGWVTGNVNHAYIDRLYSFWWIGAVSFVVLIGLARPLTLTLLGVEKAASAGVNVTVVTRIALLAVMVGTGSAVAICGPIAFVGLVVPHIVRPLVGANLALAIPAGAALGASFCLVADLAARTLFQPYVLHTGLLLDLLGGMVFIIIVKRFYLTPGARGLA